LRLIGSSRGRCNVGDLPPGAEGGVACGTVLAGGQAVAAKLDHGDDPGQILTYRSPGKEPT